jgi:hypothetical protein
MSNFNSPYATRLDVFSATSKPKLILICAFPHIDSARICVCRISDLFDKVPHLSFSAAEIGASTLTPCCNKKATANSGLIMGPIVV